MYILRLSGFNPSPDEDYEITTEWQEVKGTLTFNPDASKNVWQVHFGFFPQTANTIFCIDDLKVWEAEKELLFEDAFDGEAWNVNGSGAPSKVTDGAKFGTDYLKVSSTAVSDYDGVIRYNPTGIVKGKTYGYSYWVKLDEADADADIALKAVAVCGATVDDWPNAEQLFYTGKPDTEVALTTDWQQVTGTLDINPDASKNVWQIQFGFYPQKANATFCIDGLNVWVEGNSIVEEEEESTMPPEVKLAVGTYYGDTEQAAWDNANIRQIMTEIEVDSNLTSLSYDEWVTVTGKFTMIDESAELGVPGRFIDQLRLTPGNSDATFIVDDFKIWESETSAVAFEDSFETLVGWSGTYNEAAASRVGLANVTSNNPEVTDGFYALQINPNTGKMGAATGATRNLTGDALLKTGVTYEYSFKAIGAQSKQIVIQKDIQRMFEAAKSPNGYGGMIGTAIGPDALTNEKRMELLTYHFNNITIENQFKQDTLLGSTYVSDGDAKDTQGGYYPKMNFSEAKKILDWATEYNANNGEEDDIKIRGHVLVWHSQAMPWFFREGYSSSGKYVSKEVMNARLEHYISEVFEFLKAYPGLFYGWDVVNEAISDGGDGYRKDGDWWGLYQSEEFIINAFRYANKYAPSGIKLFYNDYNDTTPSKVTDIVTLLKAVEAHEGDAVLPTRIDGMGMQGHYEMIIPTVEEFKAAALAYQDALDPGDQLQLTELDMKATSGFDSFGNPKIVALENIRQGWHYAQIYNAICELNAADKTNFTNIVFWGTHDAVSWLNTFNGAGGGGTGAEVYPLPFDADMQAKPAYWAFVDQDMLAHNIQYIAVAGSPVGSFDVANQYNIGSNVVFAPIWTDSGLSVKVTVKDATVNTNDKVTMYVENGAGGSGNIQFDSVSRKNATAIDGGYETVLSLDVADLKASSYFRFDLAVEDNGVITFFNDTTKQTSKSDNYALATCSKAVTALDIYKGTPTIDGVTESAWEVAPVVPFTIRINESGTTTANASAKLLWDENNLYILATVEDSVLDKSGNSGGDHLQDSVEVFIDENNHKSNSYEADDMQYRVNFDNEVTGTSGRSTANLFSKVVKTDGVGYVVEAAIKWTEITPKVGTFIGLEMQINDTEGGVRLGTVSWFDASGQGYQNPSVFGTGKLVNAPAQPADPVVPSEPETPAQPSAAPADDDDEDMNDTPQTFLPKGDDGKPNQSAKVSAYEEVTLPDGGKTTVNLKSLPAKIKNAAKEFAKTVTTSEPFAYVDVVVNGFKSGKVTIKFNLYDVKVSDKIVALHQKADGTWEYIIPDKIENGAVTVTFTSLSPVVFVKASTDLGLPTLMSPKTYDTGMSPMVLVILIGCLGIGAFSTIWMRKRGRK